MANTLRDFDVLQIRALGEYVYALRDPRDRKIFYVGKGTAGRVFSHFDEADTALVNSRKLTAKLRRILEIWEADLDVEWFILRYDLAGNSSSFDVEAAIIDALDISQNGATLNDVAGHHTSSRGILTADDVNALAAPPVNPMQPFPRVLLFQIHNALTEGRSVYDATRAWWRVPIAFRSDSTVVAVGLDHGVSKGVFQVTAWTETAPASGLWQFVGVEVSPSDLLFKNWLAVTRPALGFLQRGGGYLAIEFNGRGEFRYLRGHSDKSTFRHLT